MTPADNIRILSAAMVERAKSGHPGGAMGGADFIDVLYSRVLVTDPDNPTWFVRDRFFLDPGHMSPMLYSVLALTGLVTIDELKAFRSFGAFTSGHPEHNPAKGVENTSGPLGQGHAMAVGCALAERFLAARFGEWLSHKTYAFISDGGIQEEISQGAGRLAGHLGLSNLIMFYDSNRVQLSTMVDAVDSEDVAAKYRAWGWAVTEVDGTDPEAMAAALVAAGNEKERPSLIIGHTIMGRGAVNAQGESWENRCSTHGQPLSKSGADFDATIRNLGGDPADPFRIAPEVKAVYDKRREELRAIVAKRRAEEKAWREANPALARELDDMLAGKLPEIDWKAIAHKPGVATRQASADVLAALAARVNNMIVSSADLADSDKTEAFLRVKGALKRGDFSGAFLHAGVSELTMAALMNGIALHGGLLAACATFLVFSDYEKPAIRMSALMELPVKYIWTHDSFRVGEDGPTHQPVEQEAQIRLMEQVRNLHGKRSMLVLRPADAGETTVCWQMAMENFATPTGLIFSRQNCDDLPAGSNPEGCRRGGYAVMAPEKADIVLAGNGSDVGLLCKAATLLEADGVKARVVSLPSIGLFMDQPADYRDALIPHDGSLPVYGLSSGLPSTLLEPLGCKAHIRGFDHFGSSAPAGVLEEAFGFTPMAVYNDIMGLLGRPVSYTPSQM